MKPVSFDEYQAFTDTTADYPKTYVEADPKDDPYFVRTDDELFNECNLMYPALGLAGESGEFADKVKKAVRNNRGVLEHSDKAAFVKELGDVLWYVAQCAKQLGYPLSEVANMNMDKLIDRKERDVIKSEGDER